MAILSDTDRARTLAGIMRHPQNASGAYSKADFRAALNATDQWIEDNQAAFNAALPLPFRTQATIVQKTLMFCFVAMRRAGLLTVAEDG